MALWAYARGYIVTLLLAASAAAALFGLTAAASTTLEQGAMRDFAIALAGPGPYVVIGGGAAVGALLWTAVQIVREPVGTGELQRLLVTVGIDRSETEHPLTDERLALRCRSVGLFLRSSALAFSILALPIAVAKWAGASWLAAHWVGPDALFAPLSDSQDAADPMAFAEHLRFWGATLVDLLLLEGSDLLGLSFGGLAPSSSAPVFLAAILVFKVSVLFGFAGLVLFAVGLPMDRTAETPASIARDLTDYARRYWIDAAERQDANDDAEERASTEEPQAAPPADPVDLPPITWRLRAWAHLASVPRGVFFGALLALFIYAVVFLPVGAAIAFALQQLAPPFHEAPLVVVAGATIAPAYLLWEVSQQIINRRRVESAYRTFYAFTSEMFAGFEAGMSARQLEYLQLASASMATLFRSGFAAILVASILMQPVWAATITLSVAFFAPETPLFVGVADPGFIDVVLFWLQAPIDVVLLGAPEMYGLALSPLTPAADATGLLWAEWMFKVAVAAETIRSLVMLITVEADRQSSEARDVRAKLQQAMAEAEAGGATAVNGSRPEASS